MEALLPILLRHPFCPPACSYRAVPRLPSPGRRVCNRVPRPPTGRACTNARCSANNACNKTTKHSRPAFASWSNACSAARPNTPPRCRTPRRGKNRPNPATSRPTTRTPRTQTPRLHPPAGGRGNPRRADRPAAMPPVRAGLRPLPRETDATAPSWKSQVRAHRRLILPTTLSAHLWLRLQCRHCHRPAAAQSCPRACWACRSGCAVLLDKYLFYRPTYRLLDDLGEPEGLPLSLELLSYLACNACCRLLEPLYHALAQRLADKPAAWHADETRRPVYASVEGKVARRWIRGSSTAATWWCSCWPVACCTTCRK